VTFATADEHRAHLAERAAPHSWLRRVLPFLRYLIGTRRSTATRCGISDRSVVRYTVVILSRVDGEG
jgi:hypothetical protein